MAPTNQELLDLVNTAIETRLNGGSVESYEIGGRNLRRDPLSELLKLRNDLIAGNIPAGGFRTFAELGDAS